MTTKKTTNGSGAAAKKKSAPAKKKTAQPEAEVPQVDPEIAKKIGDLRSTLRENFGKSVMALMMVPRYRSQMLSDLQHLVLDPMLADRLAFAYPNADEKTIAPDMAGFAVWASVSEEVDARIREQIASGVFPVRLKSNEWNSGDINWLLDVIATDRATVATVIGNFRQVVKEGELRLHPLIGRLVEPEVLEKMGAKKTSRKEAEAAGV